MTIGSGAAFGAGIMAMGELSRLENQARADKMEAGIGGAGKILQIAEVHEKFVFAAKSHVHGLRALDRARILTEDELISALKAENANHPMASREAVDAAVLDKLAVTILDPEVIKRTYPDGKLPKGAVIPPDTTQSIA